MIAVHPERAGLLADICANPTDDAPRLVMADWCEDNGESERADLIRTQIAYHKTRCEQAGDTDSAYSMSCNDTDCRHCMLEYHAIGLLHQREAARTGQAVSEVEWDWVGGPLREMWMDMSEWVPTPWEWRRGFIFRVNIPLASWLDCGPTLVREHPLTRVELTDVLPYHVDREPGFDCWDWHSNAEPATRLDDRWLALSAGIRPRWWPTEEAVKEAISTACLAYARGTAP